MIRNMKQASKLLNELAERGLTSPEKLREKQIDLYDERLDIQDEIKQTENQMTDISLQLKQLHTYHETKEINKKYKTAKDKEKFFCEHESELHLYQIAKKQVEPLLNENGKLPAIADLEKQYSVLKTQKSDLMQRYKDIRQEITEIEKYKASIENLEKSEHTKTKTKTDNLT